MKAPYGAWPAQCYDYYDDDDAALKEYDKAAADLSAAGVERINDYDPMVQAAVMLYVRWVIERDTQMRSVYERVKNGMALNGKYRA